MVNDLGSSRRLAQDGCPSPLILYIYRLDNWFSRAGDKERNADIEAQC
jgi:hypothetical protein